MKLLRLLNDKLEIFICVILMSVMAVLLNIQVFMRYVMRNSLSWSEELARYVFIWLVYIGISYGAKISKHIKIEAALGIFPKKARPFVVLAGHAIFMGFSVYICYTGWGVLQRQIRLGQISPAMRIPLWIVYAAPMVGFGMTAFREAQNVAFQVKLMREGEAGHD